MTTLSKHRYKNDLDYMPSNQPEIEHRVNYGRLFGTQKYQADCSCGWSQEGTRDEIHKAVRDHDGTNSPSA